MTILTALAICHTCSFSLAARSLHKNSCWRHEKVAVDHMLINGGKLSQQSHYGRLPGCFMCLKTFVIVGRYVACCSVLDLSLLFLHYSCRKGHRILASFTECLVLSYFRSTPTITRITRPWICVGRYCCFDRPNIAVADVCCNKCDYILSSTPLLIGFR